MDDIEDSPASKGGQTRSANLTKDQKVEIAKMGAKAKWDKSIPSVLLGGKLTLGGIDVDC